MVTFFKKIMLSLILLSIWNGLAQSGLIYNKGFDMDFSNQGLATLYTLRFSVQTSLPNTFSLRLVAPYDIGDAYSEFTQAGTWEWYSDDCSSSSTLSGDLLVRESQVESETNTYYLKLSLSNGSLASLTNSGRYQVYLPVNGTITKSSADGYYLGLSTVIGNGSSTDTKLVLIDRSDIFDYIAQGASVSTAVNYNYTAIGGEMNDLGGVYSVLFSFEADRNLSYGSRFRVQSVSTDFSFIDGSCINQGSVFNSISTIDPSNLTYTYTSQMITFEIASPLVKNQIVRFICKIQNPPYVSTGMINVYLMDYYADNVLAFSQSSAAVLSVSSSTWKSITTSIGWGYEVSSSLTVERPLPIHLYASYDTHQTVYNTIYFFLETSMSLPTQESLVLTCDLENDDTKITVVNSSIVNNFPAYNSLNPVTCSRNGTNIVCQNVGALLLLSEYFLSFRFSIPAGTTPSFTASFSIADQSSNTLIPATTASINSTALTVTQNLNINPMVGDPNNTGFRLYNLIHLIDELNGEEVSNTLYGLRSDLTTGPTASSPGLLMYYEHIWDLETIFGSTEYNTGDGIEYFMPYNMNNSIFNDTSYCITSTDDPTNITDPNITVCEMNSVTLTSSANFTRFRFGVNSATAGWFFPDQTLNSTTIAILKVIGFGSIPKISNTFYADDRLLDFFGRSVRGSIIPDNFDIDVLTTASTKEWLINSYAVTSDAIVADQLTNLVAGFSQLWASSSTSNDGSNFATIIRVVGNLNSADGSGIQALSVFFQGLNPLGLNSDGTYPCNSSFGNLSCYLAVGDATNNGLFYPQAMSRFDVKLSGLSSTQYSSNFQIILPVAASFNTTPIYIGLALQDTQIGNSVYYLNTRRYKKSVYNYTVVSNDISTLYDNTLRILVPSGARIGDIDFSNTTKIPSPVITLNPNNNQVDGIVGSSMQLCGIWNFYAGGGFAAASIPSNSGQAKNDQCLVYTYSSMYCLYCPISSSYSISNSAQMLQRFAYPYKYASSAPTYEYYLTYSTNNGNLSAAGRDALSIYFSPLSPKLRAKNLITINDLVTDPVNLVSTSINSRLTFSFVAASNFQKNGIITIIFNTTHPFSSSSPATCLFVNTYNSTCTLAYPNSQNITVTLSGSSDFSSIINSYIILTGMDILTIASASVNYNYSLAISDGTNTLQTVWLQDAGTFTVSQSSLTLSPKFSLNHISPNALSALSIVFSLPKTLFSNEAIQINLGSLNLDSTSQLAELACYGSASGVLASQCDTTSGTNILVTFPQEISKSTSFNITLSYIFVPATNVSATYSVSVMRGSSQVMTAFGNSLIVDTNDGLNQQSNSLTLTKKYNNPGDVLELEFLYMLQNTMNDSTTLRICFPPIYYDGLGYNTLFCTIQDQFTYCSQNNGDSRVVQLTSTNTTHVAGTVIQIKIFGIRQPKQVSNFPIFLTHDLDNNFTVISEYAFVDDEAPNPAPAQLSTTFFSSSVQSLLTTTTYQFNFTYTGTSDSSLTLISVLFPDMDDTVISSATGFGCSLIDQNNNSYTITNCTVFGMRVKVFLDTSDTPIFAQNINYGLYLTTFPNPATKICNMSKITFSLVTTDETNSEYYSYPNLLNENYMSLTLNTSVKALALYSNAAMNTASYIAPTQIITVIIGVYSQLYYIAPIAGGPFITAMSFSLPNSTFTIIKPNSNVTSVIIGDTSLPFHLGCNSTTLPSIYRVSILKNEADQTQLYTVPPQLTINAINSTVNITPADTTATVGGGVTLPVSFDLSNNIPFDDLTITATIPANSTNSVSILTAMTLVFNTTSTFGFFQFNTSASLVKGSTATVLLTLGGSNQAIYQLTKSWITITITDSVTSGPSILIRQPLVQNSTVQTISIYSSQVATIYWGVALYDSVVRDCYYIYKASNNKFTYNSSDPMQEQFGIAGVSTSYSDISITISNLRANVSYQIIACALNQQFYNSTTQVSYWTMQNNNSTVIRGQLFFQFSLTTYQEQQLSCYISNYFSLNYNAVRSPRNIICSNSTIYTSSGRLLPVSSVDIQDNFQGEQNVFLLYGSTDTETADPRTGAIISAFSETDGSAFNNQLHAYISQYPGFPPLISIGYGGNLTGFASEITGTLLVEAQSNWIAMINFQLDNSGFIYAIVDLLTSQTPTYLQIQQGLNASGLNAVQSASLQMIGGQNYTINFSSIPSNTSYVIFFYTTSEDQTIFSPIAGIYAIPINTTGQDVTIDIWVSGQRLQISLIIFLLSLLTLLFL